MCPSGGTQWLEKVVDWLKRRGLRQEDAEDLAFVVLERYVRKTGLYPCEEPSPAWGLLFRLTQDVACEFHRKARRRICAEQTYREIAQLSVPPTPEQEALSQLLVEDFQASLPAYLQRLLCLMMDECASVEELSKRLRISVGTVKSYRKELRERFVAFFGYDPTKSSNRIGINSERPQEIKTYEEPDCSLGNGCRSSDCDGYRYDDTPLTTRDAEDERGGEHLV
ncbi:MAG: hypothetical protein SNJ72_04495 [Fimbriimonadales bacterium]